MTVPSTSGHLDLDALADLLAGERTGERHVRGCATCQERLTELAAAEVAVAADLATLPSPPLPEGLSERLAGALRDEAARHAGPDRNDRPDRNDGPDRADGPGRAATVTPLRSPRRRPAASWLPAAAAAVALVLAGGFALQALQGPGPDDAATSTAAGGGEAADGAGSESAGTVTGSGAVDYADETLRTAAVADLLSRAAGADPAEPAGSGDPAAASAPTDTGTETGTDADVPAPALAAPGSSAVLDRLRDPAALAECLAALRRDGSPSAAPLALDYAAYDGAPALAVVQPEAGAATLVLTVVGPGCSGADPDTRLRTRVPRP